MRTTFTGRQIFELEKMFENKKYLSSSERTEMAKLLNVTEQQVSHQKRGFLKTIRNTTSLPLLGIMWELGNTLLRNFWSAILNRVNVKNIYQ